MEKYNILLLGAGGTAGINFAKALRYSDDYFIVGADCNEYHLALAPVDRRIRIPRADEPRYRICVESAIREHRIDFIHAQPDMEVEALAIFAPFVPEGTTLLPDLQTIRLCRDKLRCNEVLRAAGIRVPGSARYNLWEKYSEPFPKWVRAVKGAGSKGALPCYSDRQIHDWVNYWRSSKRLEDPEFMVCEYLPGDEYAWQSVWDDGELLVSQGRKRIEYFFGNIMPSGQSSTPSVAVTINERELNEMCYYAIRALDRHATGVFCIDAKRNAKREICITEVNAGRFFTTCDFFAAAGINMPDIYVKVALGKYAAGTHPQFNPLREGLYWIRSIDREPILASMDWKGNGFTPIKDVSLCLNQ